MVGDSPLLISKRGKAAGMRPCGIARKRQRRPAQEQMAAIPDKIIETLGEQKTILAIG